MKNAKHNILVGSILIGSVLVAGNVTIPNSFVANTTAKASEVNANFSAVKSAVNGNASDIAANANGIATNKSDIQTNATNIANKVTDVTAENGIVITRTDDNISVGLRGGALPIHGTAFTVSDERSNNCELYRYKDYIRFSTTSTSAGCKAFASVPIPARAKPTRLACRYIHNDSTAHTVFTMYEQHSNFNFGVPSYYTMTNNDIATIDDGTTDTHVQVGAEDVTLPQFFFNSGPSTYTIEWAPSASNSAGNHEKLYDCLVYYVY